MTPLQRSLFLRAVHPSFLIQKAPGGVSELPQVFPISFFSFLSKKKRRNMCIYIYIHIFLMEMNICRKIFLGYIFPLLRSLHAAFPSQHHQPAWMLQARNTGMGKPLILNLKSNINILDWEHIPFSIIFPFKHKIWVGNPDVQQLGTSSTPRPRANTQRKTA